MSVDLLAYFLQNESFLSFLRPFDLHKNYITQNINPLKPLKIGLKNV